MKKYLFEMLAIILAIGLSGFTIKKAHKLFGNQTFYYRDGSPNQRIESGINNGPIYKRSLNCFPGSNAFADAFNWTTTTISAIPYMGDGSSYVLSFTIQNYETTSDGDDDDGISLQEALDEIYRQYVSMGIYPSSTATTISVDMNFNGAYSFITGFTRADDGRN